MGCVLLLGRRMVGKQTDENGIGDWGRGGHRQRLRDRFQKAGGGAFADYEFLELLLSYVIPRRDTKPLAKRLIAKFGSFSSVLNQSDRELVSLEGVGQESATFLSLLRATVDRYLEQDLSSAPTISEPADIADFVRVHIGARDRECLLLICLNDANRLLHHTVVSEGSVRRAPFYPRDILKPAIVHNATRIILVHNHPSGDVVPSDADHNITRRIEALAKELDISVIDHLITTPQKTYSLMTGKLL